MNKNYTVSIADYVQVLESRSTSKVLITVPHDGLYGLELEQFVETRRKGVIVRDAHVWPIVRDVLSVFEANVVRGLLPRKFVDYNRPEWEAFESQLFRGTHEAYHGRIFRELRQMQLQHGLDAFLLLDIHGFGVQPPYAPREGYDLILGTGNRTTITHGEVDRELAHFLETRGYNVFLPSHEVEHPPHERMNGGFTVRSFAREFKVNAIQLEIAPRFRKRDSAMLGTKLSHDLGEFLSARYKV